MTRDRNENAEHWQMAEKEVEVELGDDKAVFDNAIAEQETEKPVDTPDKPVDTPKDRDPSTGRFKPKDETEPKPEARAEPKPDKPAEVKPEQQDRVDHRVPLAEHLADREKRQAAERERDGLKQQLEQNQRMLEQMEQRIRAATQRPQETPDIFANPEAFVSHLTQQFETTRREDRLNMSLNLAEHRHGPELFGKAFASFENTARLGDRATYQRVMSSPNPGEALVAWFKEREILSEIGNDPLAFKKKAFSEGLTDTANEAAVLETLSKNPQLLAKLVEAARTQAEANARGPTRNTVTRLPSLNRTTSAANTESSADDLSDGDLLRSALRG